MEEDKNWYKAELDGKEGYVPCNYIDMKPYSCVALSYSIQQAIFGVVHCACNSCTVVLSFQMVVILA